MQHSGSRDPQLPTLHSWHLILPGIKDNPSFSHPLLPVQDSRASTSLSMEKITVPFQSIGALNFVAMAGDFYILMTI